MVVARPIEAALLLVLKVPADRIKFPSAKKGSLTTWYVPPLFNVTLPKWEMPSIVFVPEVAAKITVPLLLLNVPAVCCQAVESVIVLPFSAKVEPAAV